MATNAKSGGPRPGWVYVMTNRAMPGIVKIGMTTRSPELRARDLSGATGVPEPFEVVHAVSVSDCAAVEAALHRKLTRARHRVNRRREFFRLTPDEARRAVDQAASAYRRRGALGSVAKLMAAALLAVVGFMLLGNIGEHFWSGLLTLVIVVAIVLPAFGPTRGKRRRRRT